MQINKEEIYKLTWFFTDNFNVKDYLKNYNNFDGFSYFENLLLEAIKQNNLNK